MTGSDQSKLILGKPGAKVVGTVHCPQDLELLADLKSSSSPRLEEYLDLLEFRLDCLSTARSNIKPTLRDCVVPTIVTARHPLEGGENNLDEPARLQLLNDHIEIAHAADVELRSPNIIRELSPRLHSLGKPLIVSIHDFSKTPDIGELESMVDNAVSLGADVVKIAAFLNEVADITTLVDFLSSHDSVQLSLMGMGPLGPASRLLLAQHGSLLNYGYLARENAPGQWPCRMLKSTLTLLGPVT